MIHKFYRKCSPTNGKKLIEAGETRKLFEIEKKRKETARKLKFVIILRFTQKERLKKTKSEEHKSRSHNITVFGKGLK